MKFSVEPKKRELLAKPVDHTHTKQQQQPGIAPVAEITKSAVIKRNRIIKEQSNPCPDS